PLLGDRTWGWAGHIIDILAVLATLFGLATSLGLGAQQAASGMHHVFGISDGLTLQISIIVVVTLIAIYSVSQGIDSGVKLLSNINMLVAIVLLVFVILVGFGAFADTLPKTIMGYVKNFIPLSNPYDRPDEAWLHDWTVVYWAWWISWSPFVGSFIARVSKGRTVREFLIAVLIVPTVVTTVWMSAFGGQAIHQVIDHIGTLGANGLKEVPLAMFQMYDALPFGSILSIISVLLVLVFFITSSDSGSLVIDSITAGGRVDNPVPQRIFWAAIEGAIAIALLWVGGTQAIQALQAGTISTALPFTFILFLMCISLLMGFRTERFR
ncbi:BCCT family transporter, partial [Photobacterium damselae]